MLFFDSAAIFAGSSLIRQPPSFRHSSPPHAAISLMIDAFDYLHFD